METKKLCPILMIKTSGIERNRGIFFKDSLQDGKLAHNHYDPNIEFSDCQYIFNILLYIFLIPLFEGEVFVQKIL